MDNLNDYAEAFKSFETLVAICEENPTKKNVLELLHRCKSMVTKILGSESNEMYNISLFNLNKLVERQMEQLQNGMKQSKSNPGSSRTLPKIEDSKVDAVKNLKVQPCVAGLCDIAGSAYIKKMLKTLIILPLHQPQLFIGRQMENCILLYGPPGTGKTRLVHALAAESNSELYCVTAADILNKYIGETESTLKNIFASFKSMEKSAILFIDEIDGLCKHRTDDEKEYSRRIKTEMMTQMSSFDSCSNKTDGPITKTTLICATNCPWDLDTAFIRRFHKRIYIPLPTKEERFSILSFYTKNTNLESTSMYWDVILDKTDGYSASDLANLVKHALNIPNFELEDAKVWQVIENNYFTPISRNQLSGRVICSDVCDLPPKSVIARKVEFSDLLSATEQVRKTVSDEYTKRYENYVN